MDDFETRLRRLESIGESIRDAKVPLDRAAALFEEGLKLAKSLDGELRRFEQRIEILVNKPDAPGETPVLELFPELGEPEGT